MQTKIEFTKTKYKLLKATYKIAVEAKETSFTLWGNEFATDYAKYLLEYLKPKFE